MLPLFKGNLYLWPGALIAYDACVYRISFALLVLVPLFYALHEPALSKGKMPTMSEVHADLQNWIPPSSTHGMTPIRTVRTVLELTELHMIMLRSPAWPCRHPPVLPATPPSTHPAAQ